MAETLHVENRKELGKRHNVKLRREGRLPAVLYGHGEGSVSLSLPAEEMEASLRHGARVVDLAGAESGKALVQDIQWDTFMKHVLHVDLLRVKAGEKVTVEVPIELRGEAPGSREGGVVELMVHSVEIEVPLDLVPDKLHVNINHLEVGQELFIKDIEDLPAGAKVFEEDDTMVVHCVLKAVEEEEEAVAAEATGVEPEVIAKGKEEEEGEEE
jgi:large subunit ribosomal protein L25